MSEDEKYIKRCLQLAQLGRGHVSPNPMVGAVVVYDEKIIGEGFHQKYGQAHAEVNAIASVADKSQLAKSVLYISLEACSHYGKTPPCAQLIIDSQIPKVVIASLDPNKKVSGRGVKMLQDAGIEVVLGVLEAEAKELNKAFFVSHIHHRPYVFLKWAETKDGFIDKVRLPGEEAVPTPISNEFSKMLVHKFRSEVGGIMIGTNTAIKDNPSLTTRNWYGNNPTRIVLDRRSRIPQDYHILDGNVKTIIFTESEDKVVGKTHFISVTFDENLLTTILTKLGELQIESILVEGGRELLQSFINNNLWDEAFVECAEKEFGDGVAAPVIMGDKLEQKSFSTSTHIHYRNNKMGRE